MLLEWRISMSKNYVNWAVLGCAAIAKSSVIPGIQKAANARLYAISSRGASAKLTEFKEKFNPVKAYTSYEEVLEDPEVDAVYIPLPNSLHYEWTIKAAEKRSMYFVKSLLVYPPVRLRKCLRLQKAMAQF